MAKLKATEVKGNIVVKDENDDVKAEITSDGKISIGAPYDEEKGGPLQIEGKTLLDFFYPIGSIYMSVNSINPSELFGGTWEEFAKGRTLVGVDTSQTEFNSVEKIGGAKTHTLTVKQIPSHNHSLVPSGYYNLVSTAYSGTYGWRVTADSIVGDGGALLSISSGNAGSGEAHNNLQPYITVYMWKRVA